MAQLKCPRCWKRVPEAARFCRRCGYPLHAPVIWHDSGPTPGGGPALGLLWALFILAALAALFFWGMFTVG